MTWGESMTVAVALLVIGALFGEIIFAAIFFGLAMAVMGGALMLALAVRAYEAAEKWFAKARAKRDGGTPNG